MYVKDPLKAIDFGVDNLPEDVFDSTLADLRETKRMKKWESSLNPLQKKLNQWFPGKFEGTLVPPKPEHPDVIAERDRQERLAFSRLQMEAFSNHPASNKD